MTKAAVFLGNGKIEIQDIPQPKPEKGEALVKVGLCGVCGTDAHIFNGELRVAKPPVVLGHEISGEVIALGEGVAGFEMGQHVAVNPVIGCGQCEFCHSGRSNLCSKQAVIGYIRNGGFAQYVSVPVTHLCPLKTSTSHKAGILVETLACVLNGYDRLQVKAGQSALILGAGTVGLLWNQMLLSSPITKLLQTELVNYRRQKAQKLGAHFVFDGSSADLAGEISKVCPEGVDNIIDATGNAVAVAQAIPWVRKGGTFMIFGVCAEDTKISLSPFEIYQREMKITAAKMPPGTFDRSAKLLESGRINVDEIVTTILPLEQIDEGLGHFTSRRDRAVKIAIDPWA